MDPMYYQRPRKLLSFLVIMAYVSFVVWIRHRSLTSSTEVRGPPRGLGVYWIRQLAPVLSLFRKDNASNLICLCPMHHTQFDLVYFVLVPSPNQRDLMKRHELQDFAKREEIIRSGVETRPNISGAIRRI
ncbi:hypothetical protein BJV77DRAFT_111223 [Russula vinacea]|nr:hypothetical protein BJV77DRAFT_111223 [Russula vinacea]